MMADYIRISTQKLGQDKETICGEIKGVEKAVGELWQEMQALGQTWEGPAWQAFQDQAAFDIENMQGICSQIEGFIRHMEYAENAYRTCENNVRSLVDSIRI